MEHGFLDNQNPNLGRNISESSENIHQIQNLILILNIHSKLPGNTCEERNFEKISKVDHFGVSLQESIYLSTTRKYCRATGRADSDAEFDAESESVFKTARQNLRRKQFRKNIRNRSFSGIAS